MVEVFGAPNGEVIRRHVALLGEPQIDGPNRKGRCTVRIGGHAFFIDADEMEQLWPFINRISAAIAAYRDEGGAAD